MIWQQLHQTQHHPISSHIRHQLHTKKPVLSVLPIAFVIGFMGIIGLLLLFLTYGAIVIFTVPLWLMIFSGGYIMPWLYRIIAILSRQRRNAVLDSINMIPDGSLFVSFTICHAVINDDDMLHWIQLLRHILLLIFITSTVMAMCLALSLLDFIDAGSLAIILIDMLLIAAVLHLEHQQSVIIACLLAIDISQNVSSSADHMVGTIIMYILVQFATIVFPICILILLQNGIASSLPYVSLFFALFLLCRELLMMYLWQKDEAG